MGADVERRQRIISGAAKLFAQHGIASTTVRMIGDEVGVLSGSLYHHFDSKEDIVDAIIASYFEELLIRYKAVLAAHDGPEERLRGLAIESFRSIAAHPEACEIYRNDYKYLVSVPRFAYVGKATRKVQRIWLGVIEAGVADEVFRTDIDPHLFYRFARDAIWQSARWYRPRSRHSIDQIAESCLSILMDGFRSGASTRPTREAAVRRRPV